MKNTLTSPRQRRQKLDGCRNRQFYIYTFLKLLVEEASSGRTLETGVLSNLMSNNTWEGFLQQECTEINYLASKILNWKLGSIRI